MTLDKFLDAPEPLWAPVYKRRTGTGTRQKEPKELKSDVEIAQQDAHPCSCAHGTGDWVVDLNDEGKLALTEQSESKVAVFK